MLLTTSSTCEPPHSSSKSARPPHVLTAILGSFLQFPCFTIFQITPDTSCEQSMVRHQDQTFNNGQFPVTSNTAIQRYFVWQKGYISFCLNFINNLPLAVTESADRFHNIHPIPLTKLWGRFMVARTTGYTSFFKSLFSHWGSPSLCIHPYTSWCD